MNTVRWDSPDAVRDQKNSGLCRMSIALVDASARPKTNNRDSKLGYGNETFATAILAYDGQRKLLSAGDGTSAPLVRCPFEPDNWVFRQNTGFDNVWAVRLSVDHTNKAQSKANRSTHFIDQESSQRWGQADDCFWIVERDVATDVKVNPAGFSGPLAPGAGTTRDALAWQLARNSAFISDGKLVGQLSHVWTLYKIPPKAKPQGGTPTGGSSGGGGGGGTTTNNPPQPQGGGGGGAPPAGGGGDPGSNPPPGVAPANPVPPAGQGGGNQQPPPPQQGASQDYTNDWLQSGTQVWTQLPDGRYTRVVSNPSSPNYGQPSPGALYPAAGFQGFVPK